MYIFSFDSHDVGGKQIISSVVGGVKVRHDFCNHI